MVSISSSHLFLQNSPFLPKLSQSPRLQTRTSSTHYPFRAVQTRTKPIKFTIFSAAQTDAQKEEDIVIVGAGIAGLATAVSLYRLGIQSLVLEQAESLRTGGTSLTLFKNGWRVLDALGVGKDLRTQFLEIQGMVIKAEDGRELRSFKFKEEDESQEVRAVERGILLETLANQLPSGAIRFSSKLGKIERSETGETLLQLMDGTQLSANVAITVFQFSPLISFVIFPN